MHLGVFVLGTGNHSAGWRYDGAATSNLDLSVTQEIARIAERGKFDLLFISDGLVMDAGDHPSFLCRFEPTTLISVLSGFNPACRARRHGLDQLWRALSRRPHLCLDRPHQQRPCRVERGYQLGCQGGAKFQPRAAYGSRAALRASPTNSSMSSPGCGIAGTMTR